MPSQTNSQSDIELIESLYHFIDDQKAKDILVYECDDQRPYTDYIFICSTSSQPHAKSIFKKINSFLKDKDLQPISASKRIDAQYWLVLDYGGIVIHLFYGEARSKYNLEELFEGLKSLTFSPK